MKTSIYLLFALILAACSPEQEYALLEGVGKKPSGMHENSLNSDEAGDWSLYFGVQNENAPQSPRELKRSGFQHVDATVPGNVEIDLQKSGMIEDPRIGDNVYELRKFETYAWWYVRQFDAPDVKPGERIELAFDGIDCIADIWLNNRLIASVDNMLVEHHYDVSDLLEVTNTLHVHIKSTELESRKYVRNNFGHRTDLNSQSVSIRKAPHMFGWDIMPRLMSAGLWKDVKLEIIPATHFQSIYWNTSEVFSGDRMGEAHVLLEWQFYTDRLDIDDWFLEVELSKDGEEVYSQRNPINTTLGSEQLYLNNIEYWWPRGFGEANLYDASIKILDNSGAVVTENNQKIGFRTIKLDLDPLNTRDHKGKFQFIVNNEPLFIKGTNWVPLDGLHSRDLQHLSSAMDMLVDLNCNMVRCWGGNVYENDKFYDLCDENGIMIWQDFSMGCTLYPQEQAFLDKIRVEAQKVVYRLRNHASLALWAGNNENDMSHNWGCWLGDIDPNLELISRQVLPLVIRELNPHRPYLPSSPYISTEVFAATNSSWKEQNASEAHLWGPRGYYKDDFYTKHDHLFVSEIGYHGCPNKESLIKMMGKDFVYPWKSVPEGDHLEWNDRWQCKACVVHPTSRKHRDRNNLMTNQVKHVFGELPTDLDDFIMASQIVQAEAKKYFIEFWRMDKGKRNGILWWNLRDGWPILSDAIVDYYGGKKLAYDYIKKIQTDVCVMIGDISEGNTGHPLVVVNDTRVAREVEILIKDKDSGRTILSKTVNVEANGVLKVDELPKVGTDELWLIEYKVDGTTFNNHYVAYEAPLDFAKYKSWLVDLRL